MKVSLKDDEMAVQKVVKSAENKVVMMVVSMASMKVKQLVV